MQFKWVQAQGGFEWIETTNKEHRRKGAANYLAKNIGLVCGFDLARLSEAQRWLSTFRLDATKAAKRRYVAIDEINALIGQIVEAQYAGETELAEDTDDEGASERKDMRNAAAAYAGSYVKALLTSRPFLNPLVVRNDEVLPEIVPREPKDVVDAVLSVPPGPDDGRLWTRNELRLPIARALDQLYPLGRSWIEPEDLETWHDTLFQAWQRHLARLPLTRHPAAPADQPVDRPSQNHPEAPASPHRSHSPQQPASPAHDVMDVDEQPDPRSTQPTVQPLADEQSDPELTQPAERTAEDDRRNTQVLAALEAAVQKPMAKLRHSERERLIAVKNGWQLPDLLNPSPHNTARLDTLRQTINKRCDQGDGKKWVTLLEGDGFDLHGLPATIKRLEQEGKRAQAEGYYFQVRQTLQAWSEYRLCAVEGLLPGDSQPYERPDRYVDTLEWVAPGEFRFREYKAYDPDPRHVPPKDQQLSFILQNNDYWAAILGNPYGYGFEYVFEHGVPDWTKPIFKETAHLFEYGLYVTDLSERTTQLIS